MAPITISGSSRPSRELLLRTLRGDWTLRRDDQGAARLLLSANPALIVGDVRDDQHGEHRHYDDRPGDDENDDGRLQRVGPRGTDDRDQHDDEHEDCQQPTEPHDGARVRRLSMISLNAPKGWAPRIRRTTRTR